MISHPHERIESSSRRRFLEYSSNRRDQLQAAATIVLEAASRQAVQEVREFPFPINRPERSKVGTVHHRQREQAPEDNGEK